MKFLSLSGSGIFLGIAIMMQVPLWAMEAVKQEEQGKALHDVVSWCVPYKLSGFAGSVAGERILYLSIDLKNQQLTDIKGISRALVYPDRTRPLPKNANLQEMPIAQFSGDLDLRQNLLKSLPVEIGELAEIDALYVDDNQLESLPAQIGNLKKLKVLAVKNNNLRELPAEIENLKNLRVVRLDGNKFREVPAELQVLPNLREISLAGNPLEYWPEKIGQLVKREGGIYKK